MTVDVARLRPLLLAQALRFCGDRVDVVAGLDVVVAVFRAAHAAGARFDDADVDVLAACLDASLDASLDDGSDGAHVGRAEAAFYAAVGLACAGNDAGLAVLRAPRFAANAGIETGLAQCARLALGDETAPLSFLNAALLGELAVLVGALPGR